MNKIPSTKKLGFGLMRLPLTNPDDYSSVDMERFAAMAHTFMQRGFNYFDTAYPYHQGHSETALREAVVKRYPRERFTITNKLPLWAINHEVSPEQIFQEQLERCGVDYFDFYWLHAINRERGALIEKYDLFGFLRRLKQQGLVRHIGFSFHDEPAFLDEMLTAHPEVEMVQLQINYLDWENPAIASRECYEVARRHGKPIVVMEPVKGGVLARLPQAALDVFRDVHPDWSPAQWAIKFAASLPGIHTVLSGMSTEEQLADNTASMAQFTPLTAQEQQAIERARSIINSSIAIGCTACHYCTDGCPQHIAIPEYFALYNTLHLHGAKTQLGQTRNYFNVLAGTHGRPSQCIACGQCERMCPQHLPIIRHLQQVAKTYEDQQ